MPRRSQTHRSDNDDDDDDVSDEEIEEILRRQRAREEHGFFRPPSGRTYGFFGGERNGPQFGEEDDAPPKVWSPYCRCAQPELETLWIAGATQCRCGKPVRHGTKPGST